MGGLISSRSSNDVPPIDCYSEDSFVVVGNVGVSSSGAAENTTSASCTGSKESFVHLNPTGSEELLTPAEANTANNDESEQLSTPVAASASSTSNGEYDSVLRELDPVEASASTPTSPSSPCSFSVRTKIENVLRRHYEMLVDSIDPAKAARHLYGHRIIDGNQLEMATNQYVAQGDRAGTLLQQLIRKLKANPQWCGKAVAALKRAGIDVASIVDDLKMEGIPVEMAGDESTSMPPSLNLNGSEVKELSLAEASAIPACNESTSMPPSLNLNGSEVKSPAMARAILTSEVHSQWEGVARSMTSQEGIIARFWMRLGLRECGIQDKDGNTPLHVVAIRRDLSTLERILACNPPANIINRKNNDGRTALHVSVRKQSVAMTTRLCKCGTCNPYVFDNEGKTALHYAYKSTDLVKPLLKLCSDSRFVNSTDKCGNTALHLATMGNFKEVMKLLRRSKADPLIMNHKQQTPIDIAEESSDKKMLKILKKSKLCGISWHKGSKKKMKKSSSSIDISPPYTSCDSFDSRARSSICSELPIAIAIPEADDNSSDDDIIQHI